MNSFSEILEISFDQSQTLNTHNTVQNAYSAFAQ